MGGGSGLNKETTNNFIIASFSDLTFDEYINHTEKYDKENKEVLKTLLGDSVEKLSILGAIEGSTVILTEVITTTGYSEDDFKTLMRNKLLKIEDGEVKTLFVKSNNSIYKLNAVNEELEGLYAGFIRAFYTPAAGSISDAIDIKNYTEKLIYPGFAGYKSGQDDQTIIEENVDNNIYSEDFRKGISNNVECITKITINYINDSSTEKLIIDSKAFTNSTIIWNNEIPNEWMMTNIMIIHDLDPDDKRDLDIKGYAFSDNSSLKKFEIVPGFKSIDLASGSMGGGNVFSNCSELEYVTIGKSEEGITLGESTFMNCTNLKTLIIDSKIVTADSESNHIPNNTLYSVSGFTINNHESLFLVSLEQKELSFGSENGIFSNKSTKDNQLILIKGFYSPKVKLEGVDVKQAQWETLGNRYTHKRVVVKN